MESTIKKTTTEQKTQSVLEALWLNYYNDTLYVKGFITETERNKMRLMIKQRDTGR